MGRTGWLGVLLTLAWLCCAGAATAVAEMEEAGDTAAPAAEVPAGDMAAEAAEAPAGDTAAEAAEAPAGDMAAEADAPPAGVEGSVARSTFTTGVVEREPRDTLSTLTNAQQEVAYFTELHGLEGHTVVHRWEYGGEVKAEVDFQVDGPRWRIHSTKQLDPSWVGTWTVSVLADGEVLTREEFEYVPAAAAAAEVEPASETPPARASDDAPSETPPARASDDAPSETPPARASDEAPSETPPARVLEE